MSDQHFEIANWKNFQHYKDRNPPWIKLHVEILTSKTWVMLDDASRCLAIASMVIASKNDGKIPNDPDYFKRVAYLNNVNFKPLIDIGFLIDASGCYQVLADARPEERRGEKEDIEKRQSRAETYQPPNGVLDEVWKDYLDMRKKKRSPMTKTAYKKTCDDLMKTMQDPNEVISQSVQRGWVGIFEIKQEGKTNGTYNNGNGQANRRHNPDDEIKRAYAKGLVLLNSD